MKINKVLDKIRKQLAFWVRPKDTLQNRIEVSWPIRMTKKNKIRWYIYKVCLPVILR